RPSPCSPKAWAAHTQHCYFVLLYVASNTVAAKEAPFKPESGHYVSCVARTSRTTRRRAPQEIDSHQIFRPTLARPRTAGGLTLPAGILEALEQPLEIFELQRLPRGLAQAPAQLLEDLSRALDVDLVGHLDAHSGIGTLRALRRPPHGIQLTICCAISRAPCRSCSSARASSWAAPSRSPSRSARSARSMASPAPRNWPGALRPKSLRPLCRRPSMSRSWRCRSPSAPSCSSPGPSPWPWRCPWPC